MYKVVWRECRVDDPSLRFAGGKLHIYSQKNNSRELWRETGIGGGQGVSAWRQGGAETGASTFELTDDALEVAEARS